ncbi:hypothetical protein [Streptomyces sioyaensis]|uniref:hypothetical protein n=1 Tax=Streptomyces sioyaensis TaxID=67364 RepID=UPI0037AD930F
MNGHTYAVLMVSVAVSAAAFDVVRVHRKMPKQLAGDAGPAVAEAAAAEPVSTDPVDTVPSDTVPADAVPAEAAPSEPAPAEATPPDAQGPSDAEEASAERNFGLVVLSRAAFVAFTIIAAGMLWSAESDKHWTQDKITHETEKIASDMENGGSAPANGDLSDIQSGGGFKDLVDSEVEGVVKGNGLGLKADWATPPPGAVDAYVITGTQFDNRTRDAQPTKFRACLVITSASPVPNGLPTSDPVNKWIYDYAIQTKITPGGC